MSKNLSLTEHEIETWADLSYLGLGRDVICKEYDNPFDSNKDEMYEAPHIYFIKYMMDSQNFWWFVKHIFNIDLLPFQVVILQEIWSHKFPMLIGVRGASKTFLLSLYCIMTALLKPASITVVAGAGLRQSLLLYDYMARFWTNAPMLQNIATHNGTKDNQGPRKHTDSCTVTIGESKIVCIPVGDGSRIRGLRSNLTIADEFASQNEDIFERVIGGFGVVMQDPVKNVKERARQKLLRELGLENLEESVADNGFGNQTIIAGTAYYEFNHFSRYWKRWKAIIESRGNRKRVIDVSGDEALPEAFDYRDYCIIRMPVELLPPGYMDDAQVARAKATIDKGIYLMEFGGCFSKDSEGFFKRTLIESCVCSDKKPVKLMNSFVTYSAMTRGNVNKRYVYGVDPAALQDNFAIVVVEIWGNHRRIVYCWTTNKKAHRDKVKKNLANGELDFYAYCARKLRELMKTFPCDRIGMDAQGGGIAIEEALQDPSRLFTDELRILPIIDDENPKPVDDEHGLHILEMVQFAKNDWVREANHGMRMDLENKVLLFPHFDPAALEGASLAEEVDSRFDSLEEIMSNIEELKDELASIQQSETSNGTARWDTPEVKMPGNKKGRLRKDRYSALLIANMVARQLANKKASGTIDEGGIRTDRNKSIVYEIGPQWYMEKTKDSQIYQG